MQEIRFGCLSQEDPFKKEMATHSSILAWKIPRTEEPGRLQSWWWCSQSLNHVQLCDPMDCSPAGSSVHGISEARILEWVTISFSRGSSPPRIEPGSPYCRQILDQLSHQRLQSMGLRKRVGRDLVTKQQHIVRRGEVLPTADLKVKESAGNLHPSVSSVMSDSLRPHGLQHARLPCPSPTPGSLLKLMSIESVMPFNHLILCHPLLLLPSIFPSIRVFSNESVLHIRWPKYWSFSISPSNEYSGLISFRTD